MGSESQEPIRGQLQYTCLNFSFIIYHILYAVHVHLYFPDFSDTCLLDVYSFTTTDLRAVSFPQSQFSLLCQCSHRPVLGSALGIFENINLIMPVIENSLIAETLTQGLIHSGTLFIAQVDERIFVLSVSNELIIPRFLFLSFVICALFYTLCFQLWLEAGLLLIWCYSSKTKNLVLFMIMIIGIPN